MPISLLSTKLHIPTARSGSVLRTRLLDRLNEGLKGKLTLISAPAGFGKTTLLSDWIGCLGRPAAWLSLEKEDNDPGRFWTYVLAALRTIQPDLGKDSIELQFISPQFQIDPFLTPLINEITAFSDPILLILDDYHVIDSSSIQEGMIFLLDHMPAQFHLVIASRADPSWPLARWRSRGQLMEIRAADLRFLPQEAADFLNHTMDLELSAADITALEERTEGWIAGLQMAALSLQSRENIQEFIDAFTGSNRYIFDYLAEEVLERQPAEVQEFLCRTSILDHLSAPLCDAVLDRADGHSRAILDRLEKTNLFLTPVDDVRQWYRYHHLFADILTASLRQAEPGIVPTLHLRASTWYEANGHLPEALIHALDAGDLARLVQLVERYAFTIMDFNEASSFLQQLNTFPEAAIHSSPWLSIAKVWISVYLGRIDGIEQTIRIAESHADGADPRLLGYIAALRTLTGEVTNLSKEAVAEAARAFELLPQDEFRPRAFVSYHLANILFWYGETSAAIQALEDAASLSLSAGDLEMEMTARFELASVLRVQGKLRESMHTIEKTLRMSRSFDPNRVLKSLSVGYANLRLALVHLEWNNLEETLHLAREGIRICKIWGYSDYLYNAWLIYSGILYETGDFQGALDALHEATLIFSELSPVDRVYSMEAVIRLAQGDLAGAEQWVRRSGLSAGDVPDFGHRTEYHAFSKILTAQGKLDEACRVLEGLQACAEQAGVVSLLLDYLTQEAVLLLDLGNKEKALFLIQRALEQAEPEGFVRVFINKGPGMEKLLLKAIAAGIRTGYAKVLLDKYRESTGAPIIEKPRPGATANIMTRRVTIEPISERELEVLRLLKSSLNTPEIARELSISVGTVRTHVKNIYRKLDVNRRMQAVQRARELGLI